jgi:hypothetical protein
VCVAGRPCPSLEGMNSAAAAAKRVAADKGTNWLKHHHHHQSVSHTGSTGQRSARRLMMNPSIRAQTGSIWRCLGAGNPPKLSRKKNMVSGGRGKGGMAHLVSVVSGRRKKALPWPPEGGRGRCY